MYYRQPKYYDDFKCIGGGCKYSCCCGWVINWSQEEIDKILSAPNISEELKNLMGKFEPSINDKDKLMIELGEGGRCPFLTEENLCRIQKELGAEYLSVTCTDYPRIFRMSYNSDIDKYDFLYRACRMSCPEIAKRIITDKDCMKLVNVQIKKAETIHSLFTRDDMAKRPECAYRTEIFEFFYDLISDKRYSVETAIINGAIAAQILSEVIKNKEYDYIPQALKELHSGFIKGGIFGDIEKAKPDYIMKFGFLTKLMGVLDNSNVIGLLRAPDGKLDLTLYRVGEHNLKVVFKNDDFWLRNLALNLLFEVKVPFTDENFDIFESYRLFVAIFGCFKLNAIATVTRGDTTIKLKVANLSEAEFNSIDGIWGFAAVMSRRMLQNSDVMTAMNTLLEKAKFNSAASLAALIK